jgi:Phasin protein
MEKSNTNESPFFKDLGATTEQFVQEVRGFEENYYSLIREMSTALPWLADFNNKLHRFAEQDFAAALEFARQVSRAKDMSDVVQIYVSYMQKCLQSFAERATNFAETYMNVVSGAPTFYSPK